MRICIHRGSHQIGGNCIELEEDGKRILLDLGLPLDKEFEEVELPTVSGVQEADDNFLGIVLSHGHRDHWGLLPKLTHPTTIYVGARALSVMRAAAPFIPGGYAPESAVTYRDRETFVVGPFSITPYLMDHSGFDAYGFLVEAGGKRLYYSGDLRGHGRKVALFESFLKSPPKNVDALLMEGSTLGRLSEDDRFETERDVEVRFVDAINRTKGMLLVACSAQNIDRVVSLYRAAKRTGRQLLVDAYAAEVLKATETKSIPKPTSDWADVKVYIPQAQRRMLVQNGIASVVDSYKSLRVYPEGLPQVASKSVMIIRPWMLNDLEKAGALTGARTIWSQWDGYLTEDNGLKFQAKCQELGIPFEVIHTSGHADIYDLKRLYNSIKPKTLVPIHTFFPERFEDLFGNVTQTQDGKWLEIK